MSEMHYRRQRGHEYCVHCEYETLDSMSFDEQNAAMRDHMVTAHPNWLTPEQLRVHDLLPEEERRTQERIAAVVRERDERIATLEAQLAQLRSDDALEAKAVRDQLPGIVELRKKLADAEAERKRLCARMRLKPW